jgi:hypothetical protein
MSESTDVLRAQELISLPQLLHLPSLGLLSPARLVVGQLKVRSFCSPNLEAVLLTNHWQVSPPQAGSPHVGVRRGR